MGKGLGVIERFKNCRSLGPTYESCFALGFNSVFASTKSEYKKKTSNRFFHHIVMFQSLDKYFSLDVIWIGPWLAHGKEEFVHEVLQRFPFQVSSPNMGLNTDSHEPLPQTSSRYN
jgi:hypothetical protein